MSDYVWPPATPPSPYVLIAGGVVDQTIATSLNSTTPRTLAQRFADVVNVADYGYAGAVGTGTVDDTPAINAAVAAAVARANATDPTYGPSVPTVVFPPGVYLTTGFDIPGGRIDIRALGGLGSVVILLKAGSDRSVIRSTWQGTSNYQFPVIEGLILDGNSANQSGTSYGVEFNDNGTPLYITYGRAGVVKDCHILNSLTAGIYAGVNRNACIGINLWIDYHVNALVSYSYDHQFTSCAMGHASGPVINLQAGGTSTFVNCNFYGGHSALYVGPGVNGYVQIFGGSMDGHYQGSANIYAVGPTATPTALWTAGAAVAVGAQVLNGLEIYQATTAGTCASSGTGPSSHGSSIADGSVVWEWVLSSQKRQVLFCGVNHTANCQIGDGEYPAIVLWNGADVEVVGCIFSVNSSVTGNPTPTTYRYGYLVDQQGGNAVGQILWSANQACMLGDDSQPCWSVAQFSNPENVVGQYIDSGTGLTIWNLGAQTNAAGLAGQTRGLNLKSGTLMRWQAGANNTAESGSNTGSDFAIARFSDAGAYIDSPLVVARATGLVTAQAFTVAGAASASATATLLANQSTGYSAQLLLTPRVGSGSGLVSTTNAGALQLGVNNAVVMTIDASGINGPLGQTTPAAAAVTSLVASGTISGAGATALLAPYSPLASPSFTGAISLAGSASGNATVTVAANQTTGYTAQLLLTPRVGSGSGLVSTTNGAALQLGVNSTVIATIDANGINGPHGQTTPASGKFTTFGANSATPSGKITISGSRGSATATVLESLLQAMQTYGLITDSTTT